MIAPTALLIALNLISASVFAQTTVKTCSSMVPALEGTPIVATQVTILKKGSTYYANVTRDQGVPFREPVLISEHPVRTDLKPDVEPDRLNVAEQLIAHAMVLQHDARFQKTFNSGVDLNAIATAKVYLVGKTGKIGGTAIIEAKDRGGRALGSFVAGFVIAPCAKN